MYGKHTLSIQLYSFSSRFTPFLMAIYPHSDGQPPKKLMVKALFNQTQIRFHECPPYFLLKSPGNCTI